MEYHLEDKPYTDGRVAFETGAGLESNPHEYNSNEWHLWIAGYSAAEFNLGVANV